MPKPQILDVDPRYLQPGDTILGADPSIPDVEVTGTQLKVKYVYASTTEGGIKRLPINEKVKVHRLVPTEEEQATQELERAHAWIRDSMFQAARRLESTRAELIESLMTKDITWHARRWENYAEAQIIVELWENVVKVAVAQEMDLLAAVHLYAQKLTESVIDEVRWGHRSSSDMHNLAKSLTNQVRANWLADLKWRV